VDGDEDIVTNEKKSIFASSVTTQAMA